MPKIKHAKRVPSNKLQQHRDKKKNIQEEQPDGEKTFVCTVDLEDGKFIQEFSFEELRATFTSILSFLQVIKASLALLPQQSPAGRFLRGKIWKDCKDRLEDPFLASLCEQTLGRNKTTLEKNIEYVTTKGTREINGISPGRKNMTKTELIHGVYEFLMQWFGPKSNSRGAIVIDRNLSEVWRMYRKFKEDKQQPFVSYDTFRKHVKKRFKQLEGRVKDFKSPHIHMDRSHCICVYCEKMRELEMKTACGKELTQLEQHDLKNWQDHRKALQTQRRYYMKRKREYTGLCVSEDSLFVVTDFVELSGLKGKRNQACILVTYNVISNEGDKELVQKIYVEIGTKDAKADFNFVVNVLLEKFNKDWENFSDIELFSDGCTRQYKGNNMLTWLLNQVEEHESPLAFTFNFFASNHGESVCDKVGADCSKKLKKTIDGSTNAQKVADLLNRGNSLSAKPAPTGSNALFKKVKLPGITFVHQWYVYQDKLAIRVLATDNTPLAEFTRKVQRSRHILEPTTEEGRRAFQDFNSKRKQQKKRRKKLVAQEAQEQAVIEQAEEEERNMRTNMLERLQEEIDFQCF